MAKDNKDQEVSEHKRRELLRNTSFNLRFNDFEMSVINAFCKKYGIKNKSKFMRESIITAILKKFDEDYPTLFNPCNKIKLENKETKEENNNQNNSKEEPDWINLTLELPENED